MNDSVSLAMRTRGTRRKFLFMHIRGGAVVVVIFGLTTTYAISAFHNLSSNPAHSEMYSIKYYMIKCVSDFRGFLRILWFPPTIKLTPRYKWNIVKGGVKHHNPNPYRRNLNMLFSQEQSKYQINKIFLVIHKIIRRRFSDVYNRNKKRFLNAKKNASLD